MAHLQQGQMDARVTTYGLSLRLDRAQGFITVMDLTVSETMALLQLLSANRHTFYASLSGGGSMYPCPACGTVCNLEPTATGYDGACGQCGNDFTLDLAGILIQHHYGSAREEIWQ